MHFFLEKIRRIFPKKLVEHILSESSIHGALHIVSKGRHFIERIFWFTAIMTSVVFVTSICLTQLHRYQVNPTIVSIETDYRSWVYDHISGLTMCSNYLSPTITKTLITKYWNVSDEDPKYNYYKTFINTVALTNITNLQFFEKFQNDLTLDEINMLDVVKEMRTNINAEKSKSYNHNKVITEFGLCYSTTHLYRYQNPDEYDIHTNFEKPMIDICRSIDTCTFSMRPDNNDGDITLYVHGLRDIATVEIANTGVFVRHNAETTLSYKRIDFVAADEVRELSFSRRKCLFHTESYLQYFDVYTKNLCRMECRVKSALAKCGCRPFFYNIKFGKVCTPTGLACLSQSNWLNTRSCKCPDLCESDRYNLMSTEIKSFGEFSRLASITLVAPKMRILETIWFDIDELIVSFGGADGFFLGSSFLSFMEIPFFTVEYILKKYYGIKV